MTQAAFLRTKLFILLLALLGGMSSCKETVTEEIIPSAEFAAYVSAYTGGGISQASSIRVELTQELPDVEVGAEVKGKPFSFTPSLKGKAYWADSRTIEFVPNEGELESATLYKATFKLGDFVETEKHLRKLEFTFMVVERNFAVDMKSLYIHASDPEMVTIKGELRFSDVVSAEDVQAMIKIKAGDKQKLQAKVIPTDHQLIYAFEINDVKKGEKDVTVDVEVDGKALGLEKTITSTVTIPAKSRFAFLSASRITAPENGIEVIFSEPVSTTQNLKGLIEVTGVTTRLQVKGNIVHVYFEQTKRNTLNLKVNSGITSATGKKLEAGTTMQFIERAEPPEVQFMASGTILPNSKGLVIPFRAISLYAVDVSVVRIFENNVLMFLQDNSFEGSSELRRSGRLVYKKMIRLDGDQNVTSWNNYSLDLSELIAQEPGAIYRVMLSFRPEYSAYPCGDDDALPSGGIMTNQLKSLEAEINKNFDDSEWDTPSTYYNMEYDGYDWRVFDWEEKENPCHPAYYMDPDKKVFCNVLATDLGLIVKTNSTNKTWVAVNNMIDTAPVEGAEVTLYNFQLQSIGTVKTDADGFAMIELKGTPFAAVASHGKHKTYLKIVEGEENSISRFDVGGKTLSKGLKGFVYGERGVWRPGDTLHVTFILEDREKRISDKHPVSLELYNPRGQFYTKAISTKGVNGFYTFHLPTKADDPTGVWNAYVKIGGSSFHKALRIETIKPNRLKIDLKFPNNIIMGDAGSFRADLSSAWLTGANAGSLKADVEMRLSRVNTTFDNYSQYSFNNPAAHFEYNTMEIFKGSLNSEGKVNFNFKVPNAENAPGMLQANITTRVYEPGGDASINTLGVPFSPFKSYVGVNLNQPSARYIETDADHIIDVVTLSPEGKPVNRSNLEYKIYRVNWSWWWERNSGESFASYVNNSSYKPVKKGNVQTVNGKAQITLRVNYPDWGRYLVYVKDRESGHAAGGTVYVDWPEYRGRSKKTDPNGVTMLAFSTDKESYETGETVTVTIPASSEGRALVALENGTTLVQREWVKVSGKEDTKYTFKVTPEMAPNVYLHISLLQPHAQTVNELPIRMYGVMPVLVHNKETILEPEIKMPDVLLPEEEYSVTVSEKNGKPMTYTLAVVDDGLLDITNFKTPDPWTEFYAREALGISTWDMYDQVIGAYTGRYSTLFATGGDEALKGSDAKANRFRPIVKYLGPFEIKKGGKQTHKIKLPMYVGSVRTMVVAGQDGAYGKAEKTTQVRSPLMILSTLPRVLSTGEEILLPVNVFAMDNTVSDVTVMVESSSNLQLTEGPKRSVSFSKPGDQLVYFKMKTGFLTQKEVIRITAKGGSKSTTETIEIDVRNPNPFVTLNESKVLAAGKSVDLNYQLGTKSRDNWVKLEVARIPSVDISRRLDYLYSYQHCCTEQLTSKALPLLFVSLFKDVDARELETIKANVQEAIRNLYGRQLSSGGFAYWPGDGTANEWVTTYAGTFLVLAQEKGYAVNPSVLNKWKSYQRSMARNWTPADRNSTRRSWYWQSDYQQAYRLYSLAMAGASEQGAMNRLKEQKDLAMQAKWSLASAYALSGQQKAAGEVIFNEKTFVDAYSSNNNIYGSYDRDEAMILEALVLMGREKEAFTQAQKVSKNLSIQHYFSTQSTAYALMAMGRLAEKTSGSIDFDWTLNGQSQKGVKSVKALYQTNLPTDPQQGKVNLTNKGNGSLFVDLVSRTQLLVDTLPVIANNLRLEVRYVDMNNQPFNIEKIKQGTEFKAIVKVYNTSATEDYRDIALTHIVPSGWEIYNERLVMDMGGSSTASARNFDYQDIRDDRVLTYFNLSKGRFREITVRLQATYAGEFVLPAVLCEAMYDVTVQGRTKAGRVTVER